MKPEQVMQRQQYDQYQDSMQDMRPHSAQKTDVVREEIFYPTPGGLLLSVSVQDQSERKARQGEALGVLSYY